MPPMLWQARTVKHVLVDRYGMDSVENPTVPCPCGRRVHADVCVDLTLLPIGVRKALNLHLVDYLCDGCQTRLFRELHISEEEFYSLLGAPEEAKVFHRARDPQHEIGCDLRPETFKPRHEKVTRAQMIGKKLGEVTLVSRIPISRAGRSHRDVARWVHEDTNNEITFAEFEPIAEPAAPLVEAIDPTTGDVIPTIAEEPSLDPSAVEPVATIAPDDLPADEPLPEGIDLKEFIGRGSLL